MRTEHKPFKLVCRCRQEFTDGDLWREHTKNSPRMADGSELHRLEYALEIRDGVTRAKCDGEEW